MLSVFIFYIYTYAPVKYGQDYVYPKWAEGMGLCMSLSSMVWVPGYAMYYLLSRPGTLLEVMCCISSMLRTVYVAWFDLLLCF